MGLQNKRVLVTGASGFIGGRLAERLSLEEGAQVRAMVLSASIPVARDLQIQEIRADLNDMDAIKLAVEGCDIVVHCAAIQGGRDTRTIRTLDEFRRVNVEGTVNLLRAAKDAGVEQFIHLSTINVHGYPPPQNANAESLLVFSGDTYSISKAEGERAAWEFSRKNNLPLTVIRPGCTFGPRSQAWTLTPIARVKRGTPVLVGKGDGICNAIYVDNLIDLILLAMKNKAAIGQAFIGTEGRGVTWRDFYGAYAKMLGVRRLRSFPRSLALGLAAVSEFTGSVLRRTPSVSRASFEFYLHHIVYDIEKSRRMLGYEPKISFEKGMQLTTEWLDNVRSSS